MESAKFLEQVARYYTARHDSVSLTDLIFVLPNKRSAMFLKRYFQLEATGSFVFMPRFTTFGKFIARRSGRTEAGRYEQLFTLYQSYRAILKRYGREEQAKDFDRFIFWGDMILSDFDEIDGALASPHKLYKNLKDLRDITADYLTEEQKAVIRDIWGETSMTGHVDTFWLHTGHGEDHDQPLARKFIALWQILAEVYDEFCERLGERGLATKGMQARLTVSQVKEEAPESLRRNKFVFVGHSDLTAAQIHIMKRLKDVGAADFFWDIASEDMFPENRKAETRIGAIIAGLVREFPMPGDFYMPRPSHTNDIEIVGISSSVGQAKEAAAIISRWIDEGVITDKNGIETAVVLPDQSILMSLMLALPERLPQLNVTMSIPTSTTTFATLLRAIISMQMRARRRADGRLTFFYEDVNEILSHPHLQLIAPGAGERIKRFIRQKRLYNVNAADLARFADSLSYVFKAIIDPNDVDEVCRYVVGLIEGLKVDMAKTAGIGDTEKSFEINTLDFYLKEIREMYDVLSRHSVTMNEITFFMLVERILNTGSLKIVGTPLEGVQVMGVLETRALDFDNVVILSMNERTFPRRDYVRTMIPNNLRRGYGLPPIEQSEGYYAYYFSRLLARARHTRLIYDARPGHRGGGELSRYVTQLLYLHDKGNIRHYVVEANGIQPSGREITVKKTEGIMQELGRFMEEGGPRFSASALKTYMICPLKFYLSVVKKLREPAEVESCISPAMQGDIYHHTMNALFKPFEGKTVDVTVIEGLLKGNLIYDVVKAQLCSIVYNSDKPIPDNQLNSEALLVASMIKQQVVLTLEAEKESGLTFTYIAGEKEVSRRWQITPDICLNFVMFIDRVDRLPDGTLRFIDYKSGLDDLSVGEKLENLFNGNHSRHGIFQLMLYAAAYHDLVDESVPIELSIYKLRDIAKNGYIAGLTYNKKPLSLTPEVTHEFRRLLESLIAEIFNADCDFGQCADTERCMFCQFRQLCGREVAKKDFGK